MLPGSWRDTRLGLSRKKGLCSVSPTPNRARQPLTWLLLPSSSPLQDHNQRCQWHQRLQQPPELLWAVFITSPVLPAPPPAAHQQQQAQAAPMRVGIRVGQHLHHLSTGIQYRRRPTCLPGSLSLPKSPWAMPQAPTAAPKVRVVGGQVTRSNAAGGELPAACRALREGIWPLGSYTRGGNVNWSQ